jgi:5-methylcytosine-specific restriction endonuclease McrA
MESNSIYYWTTDENTGFRKVNFIYTHDNIKEIDKFNNWSGKTRICSKCKNELPEVTYYYHSGGNEKLHRYCKICEGSDSYCWGKNYNNELNSKGFHYCNKCDRVLPLNELYFNRTTGKCNKTGFSSNCKECISISRGFGLYSLNDTSIINDIKENYKICQGCNLELPNSDEFFFKKNDRKNGSTHCKVCKGFEYGIHRLNVALKDTLPENHRYCQECKNLIHVSEMTNDSLCKECAIPKRKLYNQNPEVKESKRMFAHKRRSLKKKLRNDLTQEEYHETLEYFDSCCVYCEIKPNDVQKLQQEHIHPISKGGEYTKANIVPACESCNKSKNNKSIDEFYDFSEKFSFERYTKIINFIKIFK